MTGSPLKIIRAAAYPVEKIIFTTHIISPWGYLTTGGGIWRGKNCSLPEFSPCPPPLPGDPPPHFPGSPISCLYRGRVFQLQVPCHSPRGPVCPISPSPEVIVCNFLLWAVPYDLLFYCLFLLSVYKQMVISLSCPYLHGPIPDPPPDPSMWLVPGNIPLSRRPSCGRIPLPCGSFVLPYPQVTSSVSGFPLSPPRVPSSINSTF